MQWWIWLVAAVALVIVEVLTPGGFYFVFFGLGAAVAGGAALLGLESLLGQTFLAVGVSAVAVGLFRKPLLAKLQKDPPAAAVDSLVGETAISAGALHPGEYGQAELRGTSWKVRNVAGVSLAAGQRCIVEQVEGLTLYIRPAD